MSPGTISGPEGRDSERTRRRRRAAIRRRRATALTLIVLAVAAAVATPLACRDSNPDGPSGDLTAALTGGSTSSVPPDLSTTSSTSRPVPTTQPATSERAEMLKANEMGLIPVLMYHAIKPGIVSPKRLREDIAQLKTAGFYPTTVREMAEGRMEIPAGKSPVILTFDDSSPTHYRILDNGTLDPDCVVAILQAAAEAGDWAPKATFFPLLYVDSAPNILFGQPDYAEQKLRNLVKWGFEVGSHTITHQDLSIASLGRIKKELAQSKSRLEALIGGGYEIYTLSPPYGEYPDDEAVLVSGEYEGTSYHYPAVVMAWGGRALSPFSDKFDPVRIPRITAYPKTTVADLIAYFESHPESRYVSDGDTDAVSVPEDLPAGLGSLRDDLTQRVVRY